MPMAFKGGMKNENARRVDEITIVRRRQRHCQQQRHLLSLESPPVTYFTYCDHRDYNFIRIIRKSFEQFRDTYLYTFS